jgi:hypothetical protein
MEKLFQGSYRSVRCCITLMVLAATCLSAAPTITQVTPNATSVGKYALLELTVSLTATYTNAYDPTEVALSAVFTAPSGKTWTINGFYDGSLWKVRFAANETGTWNYVVKLTDATGSTQSASQNFSCTASSDHGWVKVAPNNRYLCCDDGTSFYGIGMAYCWSVTEGGLSALGADKCNTWVYWNGTYDGYNLIESPSSGIGKYDQAKCARIDDLLSWSEASGMKMILVLWPHDYLLSHADGSWTDNWSLNAYQSIVSCADFYSDATSWAYQAKQYQYDIARWGYSTALLSWQLIDEISGTEGYMDDATTANAWAAKIATFFQTNDPFHHPTESSLGGYWTQGDAANTMTNTENYGDESATGWASLAQQLWNGYDKPAMTGEAGGGDCNTTSIFSAMANGECINPMFWQYNQGTNSSADLAIFPGFAAFVNSINFAGLTNLALAKVTVSGATAYGVSSDQDVFGWITGTVSGKTLSITGLANNGYNSLEWWDCTAGTHTTSAVSATNGTLTATIPTTSEGDIAFQLTSPTAVIARSLPAAENYKPLIVYRQGALRLLEPITGGGEIKLMNIQGRVIASYKVPGSNITVIPAGRLESGIYFASITSGKGHFWQKLQVTD